MSPLPISLLDFFSLLTKPRNSKEVNPEAKVAQTIHSEEDRYIVHKDGKPINELSKDRLEVLNGLRDNPKDFFDNLFAKNKLSNEEKERKLSILTEIMPGAVIENYERYKDLSNADSILVKAANQSQKPSAHASSQQAAIACYEHYKSSKQAEEILFQAILKNPIFALVFPEFYKSSPHAKLRLEQAAMRSAYRNPYFALREFEKYKDEKYADKIIEIAVKNAATKDPHCVIGSQSLFKDKPYAKEVLQTAEKLVTLHSGLITTKDIQQREKYIKDNLSEINNNLLPALSEFNKIHNTSLKPMGIIPGNSVTSQDMGYEFVFINTFEGKDKTPIRIGITYDELKNTKTKENLIKLLNNKVSNEKTNFSNQYNVWNTKHDYDLPKDKTAAMVIGVHLEEHRIKASIPGERDKGQNDDTLRMIELYQNNYGAKIYSIHMQFPDDWESTPGVKGKISNSEIPKTSLATKKEILESFEKNLKKAIDEGKEAFVLQYMMHGSEIGTMAAADGQITPEDFAQILEKKYNDKALAEQIDITVMADSCFSGMQIEKMIAHLEKNKTPVKNLRIVASASRNTPGTMSLQAHKASLYSDKLNKDWNGAFFYYLSYYYELLEVQKKNGVKIENPIGAFSHAIRFADLMTTYDSIHGARPQAYHYQHLPKEKKSTNEYFSQRETISEELNKTKDIALS